MSMPARSVFTAHSEMVVNWMACGRTVSGCTVCSDPYDKGELHEFIDATRHIRNAKLRWWLFRVNFAFRFNLIFVVSNYSGIFLLLVVPPNAPNGDMDNVVHAMPRGPCTPQFTEYDTDMDISKCIVHVIRPCCVQSHGCLRQRTVPFIQETITSRSLSLFHCSLLPCKIKKKASTYSHSISVVKTSPNQEANTTKKKFHEQTNLWAMFLYSFSLFNLQLASFDGIQSGIPTRTTATLTPTTLRNIEQVSFIG